MSPFPTVPADTTERLALPFGVIGAAGGGLVAQVISGGSRMDWGGFTALLVGSTAIVAAVLGRLLARNLSGCESGERYSRTIFGAMLAGAINGGIVYLVVIVASVRIRPEALIGAPFAGIFGAVVAVPFLPSLCLVVRASATARGVRSGSIAGDCRRRAVWRAVCASLAVACIVSIPQSRGVLYALVHHGPTQLALVCALAVAWLTLVELAQARRAHALRALHRDFRDALDPAAVPPTVARLVDYGVGSEVRVESAPTSLAYRAAEEIQRVALGDPARAIADLHRAARGGAIALALSGAVLVCHFAAALSRSVDVSMTESAIGIDAHID